MFVNICSVALYAIYIRRCRSVGAEYDINHWFSEKFDASNNENKMEI